MQKYLTWTALSCSMIAGVLASEFVSSLGRRSIEEAPASASVMHDVDLPAKVALGATSVDLARSLNN